MKNQHITFTAIFCALLCVAPLAPNTFGVSPPPDGCYPGFTTAEGCNALNSLTTGFANTAVGWRSLLSNGMGSYNTAVGAGALLLNDADSNTAVGTAALLLNTAGTGNSALGTGAMVNNDSGINNTAVGSFALQTNTNGSNNTAVGNLALQNATDGNFNTALGSGAGTDPNIVSNNIYIGDPGFPGDENVIAIGGVAASGIDYENTYIGGIHGASVNIGTAVPVYVDTDGHLGTNLVNGSATKLRTRSLKGAQPQVKINQFQKYQKRIAELESTVARLAATVKEQAAQIEKVSAHLELRKPVRRVVAIKE